MREIKFRAWDKKRHRIYSWEQINSIYNTGIIMIVTDNNDWMIMPGDYELLEYTGLEDKNGKEIYEGDYIKGLGVVKWSDTDGAWIVGEWLLYTKVHIEVIGNIWENKELGGE